MRVASAACARNRHHPSFHSHLTTEVPAYIDKVKSEFLKGLAMGSAPWVCPKDPFQAAAELNAQRDCVGERRIDAKEALNLILHPTMFLWAPDCIDKGLRLSCPACGTPCSRSWWGEAKILHGVSTCSVYVSRRHACSNCPAQGTKGKASARPERSEKTFSADSREVVETLPLAMQSALCLSRVGHSLCDDDLTDFIRSSATHLSWRATSQIISEMRATAWTRRVAVRYFRLCDMLSLRPVHVPRAPPAEHRLSCKCIRNLYLSDYHSREEEIHFELGAETGDAILKVDWTVGAAARCGWKFLFNAATGANKMLATVLTDTSCPTEVESSLRDLCARGVAPKVIYVDDECCRAWSHITQKVWPGCCVRLDAHHALKRLTATTASTRNPWHGRFCSMLSDALFTYDAKVLQHIQKAMARHGHLRTLTKNEKKTYVPRVIQNPQQIAKAIDTVIDNFRNKIHCQMGALLTPSTSAAWENLRRHVCRGCLCDPPGVDVVTYEDAEGLRIGNEVFHHVRKLHGTSSLEGFHSHQKRWLGPMGTHAQDTGQALLNDGNLRWNRQRRNDALPEEDHLPPVFAKGLLQEARHRYQQLPDHTLPSNGATSTECAEAMRAGEDCQNALQM